MNREQLLRRRIKLLTWLFIGGLFLSGVTAIPLNLEMDRLINFVGIEEWGSQPANNYSLTTWLFRVRDTLSMSKAITISFLRHGLAGVRAFCHRDCFHRRVA